MAGRHSRGSVFFSALDDYRGKKDTSFVRVITTEGTIYHGHPEHYSGGLEDGAVLLRPAFREVRAAGAAAAQGSPAPRRVAVPRPAPNDGCVQVPDGVYIAASAIRFIEFRPVLAGVSDYFCDDPTPTPTACPPAPAKGSRVASKVH